MIIVPHIPEELMALITTWYPSGTGEIYENIIRIQ
jgi:hypothetical protein